MLKHAGLALVAAIGFLSAADAQEVTLRGVTSFAEKTTYSRGFEKFIERVNAEGKGVVHINYIGGPKAMPPFEVGNALKNGVVDIANVTGAFYTNRMPEADAWKLTQRPMADLRKNGGFDYMAKLYAQKLNAVFLARVVDNNPFHLYLNKKIDGPDLKGLKQRGVVDGYGWPITGVFDLGWNERTKYRVDPGFYSAEVSILINKSVWDKLNDKQKAVLQKAAEQAEAEAVPEFTKENAAETERQAKAGIQTITFDAANTKRYVDEAYKAGWDGVIRQSAEHGPKLRTFFAK